MANNSSNLGDLSGQQLDNLRGQLKTFVGGGLSNATSNTDTQQAPDDVPHTSHSDNDGWV